MKSPILDEIYEGTSNCYLSKITLKDYINSLPEGYKEYEIQREIVKNTYLDNLIDTVLENKHIPPIVLVVDEGNYSVSKNKKELHIKEFKIIDGLQRTFRLKLIWDTMQFFIAQMHKDKEILGLNRIQLSRKYSNDLEKINSNSKILNSIIKFYSENIHPDSEQQIKKCFENNQWFEVWTNLTPEEEVKKMLILNAGHKPVKTKHQLELLFRSLIPIVKKVDLVDFVLIREKEMSSITYSKQRKYGQFHFSHLITSVLSLDEGKPVTTNVNLVHRTQESDFEFERFEKYFNYDFLHLLISSLLRLDKSLTKQYKKLGIQWVGREVSLVGLFAALGKYAQENTLKPVSSLEYFKTEIIDNPACLNLEEFEIIRNKLNLSKVNIGTANKNAVYNGIFDILTGVKTVVNWSNYFKGQVV